MNSQKDSEKQSLVPSSTSQPSSGRSSETRSLHWRRTLKWFKRFVAAATALPTILFVCWIALQIILATVRPRTVDLQEVSVPESLTKTGLTAEVATRQLRDAIQEIHEDARTNSVKNEVELPEDAINITIPKAGVSIDAVATAIRHLLPGTLQNDVSGEITQSETGALSMCLRINGRVVFFESDAGANAASVLIKHGALRLVSEVEPYIAAFWLYRNSHGDTRYAEEAADLIIASFPPNAEAIARAYNLKGLIAKDQNNLANARYFFGKAASDLPIAWSNIGDLDYVQGNLDEAKKYYQINIRLTPNDSYPYNMLGDVLDDQGNLAAALAVYDMALTFDNKSPELHRGRANILTEEGRINEAIAEYRLALSFFPNYAAGHNGLGNALLALGKIDEASSEYVESMRLNSKYAKPHNGLGNVLREQNKIDEAIVQYRAAISLNSRYAAAYDGLSMALMAKGETAEALADQLQAVKLSPKLAGP